MVWCAAHLMYLGVTEEKSESPKTLVFEHVVLMDGPSDNEQVIWEKAKRLGLELELKEKPFEHDGKLYRKKFRAVRKLVTIMQAPDSEDEGFDEESPPIHRAEISYQRYTVQDLATLGKLLEKQPVAIRIENPGYYD